MLATDLKTHIHELESERILASLHGLNNDAAYMADLTEIATLRAELSGPQVG